MTALLELKNIHRSFRKKGQEPVQVLKGIDLTLTKGEMVALVAPSGSGKSTLLNIVGLLDDPTEGEVIFDGHHISKSSDQLKTKIRGCDVGFVFQFHNLLAEFSCLENIALPMLAQDVPESKAFEKARKLLDLVGLSDKMNHRPAEISGGQQQRVSICRSLANSPKLLLADEPTGNLDPETSEKIFTMFQTIIRKTNLSALIVTHDHGLASRMDRTVVLENGKLKE